MKEIQKTNYDVIVVGAGASGMMAAGTSANLGKKTLLIEKNKKPGRKLMITGKGRCNLTNNCSNNKFIESVIVNSKFLYSAINNFPAQDTINFFENLGVKTKTERGNRIFPLSDKASDVVDALYKFVLNSGCEFLYSEVKKINVENKKIISVTLSDNTIFQCKKVILACGGVSYPYTGSNGSGFELSKSVGHKIIDLKPSLVPLISSSNYCKSLQGLSLKNIHIDVLDKKQNKIIFSDFGELLFTHFGLSGPIILSASSHMRKSMLDRYKIHIDLKPALSKEQLDKRLQRDFVKNNNKCYSNSLHGLLPKKLIPVIISIGNIETHCKCNSITKKQRLDLVDLLKCFSFDIVGFRPIEEAIITSGGVDTKQINPKTMESKIINGLYFAGEMIDIDAYTGGFNLQIAFSTGYLSAIS